MNDEKSAISFLLMATSGFYDGYHNLESKFVSRLNQNLIQAYKGGYDLGRIARDEKSSENESVQAFCDTMAYVAKHDGWGGLGKGV